MGLIMTIINRELILLEDTTFPVYSLSALLMRMSKSRPTYVTISIEFLGLKKKQSLSVAARLQIPTYCAVGQGRLAEGTDKHGSFQVGAHPGELV